MAEIFVDDAVVATLRHKVIGEASGIGLCTATYLLSMGAYVVAGDINGPTVAIESDNFTHITTDVSDWDQLKRLFKAAIEKYGRVDHIFANAGIGDKTPFIDDELDEDGDPKRPSHRVAAINYLAVLDTVKLSLHYLRKNPQGGSIVLSGSASSYQALSPVYYTSAKHAVLGIMRALSPQLLGNVPIRVNTIAPSWTDTGLFPADLARGAGLRMQPPLAVAKSVALLMADEDRKAQLLYSCEGRYTELETDLVAAADGISARAFSVTPRTRSEWDEMQALVAAVSGIQMPT